MLLLVVVAWIFRRPDMSAKRLFVVLFGLLLLTAVFDNVIIGLHIVAYHSEHISGLYIGKVPIEDFSYTLAACLLIPLLWGKDHAA